MSTKTLKFKSAPTNGVQPTRVGKSSNGKPASHSVKKKSMYERWIEKYGVDDSKAAKALLRAWQKTYENRQKSIK